AAAQLERALGRMDAPGGRRHDTARARPRARRFGVRAHGRGAGAWAGARALVARRRRSRCRSARSPVGPERAAAALVLFRRPAAEFRAAEGAPLSRLAARRL